jgi:hypothetical protein
VDAQSIRPRGEYPCAAGGGEGAGEAHGDRHVLDPLLRAQQSASRVPSRDGRGLASGERPLALAPFEGRPTLSISFSAPSTTSRLRLPSSLSKSLNSRMTSMSSSVYLSSVGPDACSLTGMVTRLLRAAPAAAAAEAAAVACDDIEWRGFSGQGPSIKMAAALARVAVSRRVSALSWRPGAVDVTRHFIYGGTDDADGEGALVLCRLPTEVSRSACAASTHARARLTQALRAMRIG